MTLTDEGPLKKFILDTGLYCACKNLDFTNTIDNKPAICSKHYNVCTKQT